MADFPTTLADFTEISCSDRMNDNANNKSGAQIITDLQEELAAAQAKIGVNSSAVTSSLDYKLTNTSSSNPGHKHTLANGATDVTASAAEVNIMDGVTASTAELNYNDSTFTAGYPIRMNSAGTAFESDTTDGWQFTTDTWTYASATSFTISGVDRTAVFPKGTRIKLTQTTEKYFYVMSSSFSTNTTVNITGGSDYSLANAAITSNYYSYALKPQAFPFAFNWTPTFGGFSSDPASGIHRFNLVGNMVTVFIRHPNNGTSNATTFTISAPITALTVANMLWFTIVAAATDNGATSTTVDDARISSAGTNIEVAKNHNSTGWTNSGGKRATFTLQYEI